jgi:hypothetical protein
LDPQNHTGKSACATELDYPFKKLEFFFQEFRSSSSRGQKLVAIDPRGNSAPPVVRFYAHNFRKTPDVDISGHGDFTGQSEDKFDGRSGRKIRRFNQKIETAETDVPRLSSPFASARIRRSDR